MKWKNLLLVGMLVGILALAMVGCSEAEELTPTTEQAAPTPDGTGPELPEGIPSDNMSGDRPSPPTIDLAAAAAELGVTEEQLSEALGESFQGPMDLAAAAEELGVSEESLREALGIPEGGSPPGGAPPGDLGPIVEEQ